MTSPTFSLCVYCGSRPGAHPAFTDTARAVGEWMPAAGAANSSTGVAATA